MDFEVAYFKSILKTDVAGKVGREDLTVFIPSTRGRGGKTSEFRASSAGLHKSLRPARAT